MRYIGIDLAWTTKNETGMCVLDGNGEILHLSSEVYSNEEIFHLIKDYYQHPTVVAIDAPIVVPNEVGSRPAESALARQLINGHRIRAFHCSRSYLIEHYGSIRAEGIAHNLSNELGFKIGYHKNQDSIVETLPTGIIASLIPEAAPFKYKLKRGVTISTAHQELASLISNFQSQKLSDHLNYDTTRKYTRVYHKHLEDQVDAFLCALMAREITTTNNEPLIFGDYINGFIMLPNK